MVLNTTLYDNVKRYNIDIITIKMITGGIIMSYKIVGDSCTDLPIELKNDKYSISSFINASR